MVFGQSDTPGITCQATAMDASLAADRLPTAATAGGTVSVDHRWPVALYPESG